MESPKCSGLSKPSSGRIMHVNITNHVVCFLLGNSPASEFYMPTFRNTLSVPSSEAGRYEEGTDRVLGNVVI